MTLAIVILIVAAGIVLYLKMAGGKNTESPQPPMNQPPAQPPMVPPEPPVQPPAPPTPPQTPAI